jgi:malate dehydrogenase
VSTVAILGAGEIGGALARQLAAVDAVSRIVLIDEAASVAAGKALDIAQAAPVDRYSTSLSGTSDLSAVAGTRVIVIADRFGAGGEWRDEDGLAMLKRVAGLNQLAVIVCAGPQQTSLVERGVSELRISRNRLFGSAPEALRSAIVTMTALEAKAAPADVSLSVLGRPQQAIVPWDEGAIAGRTATQVLSAAQLVRLNARIARLWPPGPTTLAGAATRLIRSALTRSPRAHIALVALTKEEGTAGKSAMLPVTLGPAGIAQLLPPSLSTKDRVRLESALRA